MTYPMQYSREHITQNMEMPKPGVDMRELRLNTHVLDDQYKKCKSGCLMHGMGLWDKWPLIAYSYKLVERDYDYVL